MSLEGKSIATHDSAVAILQEAFAALPEISGLHRRDTLTYAFFANRCRQAVHALFAGAADTPHEFGPFGVLRFPYEKMGQIDSLDLFGLDELIIFAFYWANRRRYRRVSDLGANIGLHSFCMARSGYEVQCYEPDPATFELLKANLARNALDTVESIQAAVSVADGTAEFLRLHGNRTGSHLAGAKANPYGEIERFNVELKAFKPILERSDLLKIDVEGHEAKLILSTERADWAKTDAVMEIGSVENAAEVYAHLHGLGVNMFSQKLGWQQVRGLSDVPTSHREGSLFVTLKDAMPWGA
jgi:FkbM family methyltransferase